MPNVTHTHHSSLPGPSLCLRLIGNMHVVMHCFCFRSVVFLLLGTLPSESVFMTFSVPVVTHFVAVSARPLTISLLNDQPVSLCLRPSTCLSSRNLPVRLSPSDSAFETGSMPIVSHCVSACLRPAVFLLNELSLSEYVFDIGSVPIVTRCIPACFRRKVSLLSLTLSLRISVRR